MTDNKLKLNDFFAKAAALGRPSVRVARRQNQRRIRSKTRSMESGLNLDPILHNLWVCETRDQANRGS